VGQYKPIRWKHDRNATYPRKHFPKSAKRTIFFVRVPGYMSFLEILLFKRPGLIAGPQDWQKLAETMRKPILVRLGTSPSLRRAFIMGPLLTIDVTQQGLAHGFQSPSRFKDKPRNRPSHGILNGHARTPSDAYKYKLPMPYNIVIPSESSHAAQAR
jgi:hypothetical protein